MSASPVRLRGEDAWGSGAFGAPRGDHAHRGIDIIVAPGDDILSPVDGTFVRIAEPYDNDARFSGVLLRGSGDWSDCEVKLFYFAPRPGLSLLQAGEKIGVAQDIALRYPDITCHIHLELWQDGEVVDPTPFIELQRKDTA